MNSFIKISPMTVTIIIIIKELSIMKHTYTIDNNIKIILIIGFIYLSFLTNIDDNINMIVKVKIIISVKVTFFS